MRYADLVGASAQEISARYADESPCVVNTEVNSGNFIVNDGKAFLVDWEKAVISHRYQDLAHFLVPTTTLWKSEFRYTDEARTRFLDRYRVYAQQPLSLAELSHRSALMERIILLRALSWCYMAYFEYSAGERTLTNQDTFRRIRHYLDEIEWFLP